MIIEIKIGSHMKIICTHCHCEKSAVEFYKNARKLNGLDSQCKTCILLRKSAKYKKVVSIQKKNKALRRSHKTRVLDIGDCTFKVMQLNTIFPERDRILKEELIRGILCQLKK